MENQIVCPNCKKTIANNSTIDDAVSGSGSDTQSMICTCGERITYWNIAAQLRGQKTMGLRLKN